MVKRKLCPVVLKRFYLSYERRMTNERYKQCRM